MIMRSNAAWLGVVAVLVLAACDDDGFDPATRITGPRVLAITTEPSALPFGGDLVLEVWTVDPEGPRSPPGGDRSVDTLAVRACTPWKFVTDPTLDCQGADALALVPDESGRIVMSSASLATSFPPPGGAPSDADAWSAVLAAGVEVQVPVIAHVVVDGETVVARRDISVVAPTIQRNNPSLVDVRFDGVATQTLHAGQRYRLTVTIDGASLDQRVDPTSPGELETVVANFYSPSGELSEPAADFEVADAAVVETTAIDYVAGAAGTSWLFIVATDETGGMSRRALPLTLEPTR